MILVATDRVRTDSYRDFILNNPQIFKDAVVLDVGCGTGVLSMFAAKSGAKKVYAVDASAIAFKAERNIKANGYSDVITVVKGKVENIEIPEKVDVIVSEWMGYFLLYECMLDSVLHARDRFMKPTGLMVPSQCSILLSLMDGSRMKEDRIKFWDNVYGFDMTAMKEEIADDAMIDVFANSEVVSDFATLSVSLSTAHRDSRRRQTDPSPSDHCRTSSLKRSPSPSCRSRPRSPSPPTSPPPSTPSSATSTPSSPPTAASSPRPTPACPSTPSPPRPSPSPRSSSRPARRTRRRTGSRRPSF